MHPAAVACPPISKPAFEQYTTSRAETILHFVLRLISTPAETVAIVLTILIAKAQVAQVNGYNDVNILGTLLACILALVLDGCEILALWPAGAKIPRLPPLAMFFAEILLSSFATGTIVALEGLYEGHYYQSGNEVVRNKVVDATIGITGVYLIVHFGMMVWSVVCCFRRYTGTLPRRLSVRRWWGR